jgi:FixJ family two-component response regulator
VTDAPTVASVDDDASVRRSLYRLVRSAGYAVETFASAREYLEWLPHGHAVCVVLDIHMEEMNGFELPAHRSMPIIFITSDDDAVTRTRIEKSGAAAHLSKPFDDHAILDAIQRAAGLGPAPIARP